MSDEITDEMLLPFHRMYNQVLVRVRRKSAMVFGVLAKVRWLHLLFGLVTFAGIAAFWIFVVQINKSYLPGVIGLSATESNVSALATVLSFSIALVHTRKAWRTVVWSFREAYHIYVGILPSARPFNAQGLPAVPKKEWSKLVATTGSGPRARQRLWQKLTEEATIAPSDPILVKSVHSIQTDDKSQILSPVKIAYHEAGHAVVAAHLGLMITKIERGRNHGTTQWGWDQTQPEAGFYVAYLITAISGLIAESRRPGSIEIDAKGSESDLSVISERAHALWFLRTMEEDYTMSPADIITDARKRATAILDRHFDAVERVAERLLESDEPIEMVEAHQLIFTPKKV